jgi:hypothetical protein
MIKDYLILILFIKSMLQNAEMGFDSLLLHVAVRLIPRYQIQQTDLTPRFLLYFVNPLLLYE